MYKRKLIAVMAVVATLIVAAESLIHARAKKGMSFTVRIENVANKDGLAATDGSKYPFALSPGMYTVSRESIEFFRGGKKASPGLEAQAEDGDPGMLYDWATARRFAGSYGIFSRPAGAAMDGPILPSGAYEFSFAATEGMQLNMIAMYGQSNDLFYAPAHGIELFDKAGDPVAGDITDQFLLWDAGTEVNQSPGIGSDQAPRQKMKNSGTAENKVVGPVEDGFAYPATKDVLRVTVVAR